MVAHEREAARPVLIPPFAVEARRPRWRRAIRTVSSDLVIDRRILFPIACNCAKATPDGKPPQATAASAGAAPPPALLAHDGSTRPIAGIHQRPTRRSMFRIAVGVGAMPADSSSERGCGPVCKCAGRPWAPVSGGNAAHQRCGEQDDANDDCSRNLGLVCRFLRTAVKAFGSAGRHGVAA